MPKLSKVEQDAWSMEMQSKRKELFELANTERSDRPGEWYYDVNPKDVQQSLDDLQKDTQSRTGRCLRAAQPFFNGIKELEPVITPILTFDPYGAGAFIWGGLKVFIELLKRYTDLFSEITDFLNKTGQALERLQILHKAYEKIGAVRFSECVRSVFCDYLRFFQCTKSFFESSKWHKVKDTLHLSKNNGIDLIKTAMTDVVASSEQAAQEAEVAFKTNQLETSLDHSEKLRLMRDRMDEINDENERRFLANQRTQYLKWLDHVDLGGIKDNLLGSKQSPESTGAHTWIFSDERFRRWTSPRSASPRVLWLTGNPGFGKSTLAASVVHQMQRWYPTGVSYFFCRYQEQQTRTVAAILRTWIWQLLRSPEVDGQKYSGHLTFPDYDTDYGAAEFASVDVLSRIMRRLFKQRRPTWLMVDGLDECLDPISPSDENEWKQFFELLKQMPSTWKVLMVSRPRVWYRSKLLEMFGHGVEREINAADNSDNLRAFVEHRLRQIQADQAWTEEQKKKASGIILERAEGVFMWVELFCSELETFEGRRDAEINAALAAAPLGLDKLYQRTMDTLNRQDAGSKQQLKRALLWVLCAPRTLLLGWLEIAAQLTPVARRHLEDQLGSFVRCQGRHREVVLVHASARDYLLSDEAALVDVDSMTDQSRLLPGQVACLKRCLDYLSSNEREFVPVGPNFKASTERIRAYLIATPFLEYSSVCWIQHLEAIAKRPESLEQVKVALQTFFANDRAVLKWLQVLHFLVQFGYPGAQQARHLLGSITFHEPKPDTWQAFFHVNFPETVRRWGWSESGRFMRWDRFMHFRPNYDVHWRPFYQSPQYYEGASIAALFDYEEVLKEMILDGVDINKVGPLHSRPIHWAAAADACNTLRLLLEAGANVDVEYEHTKETPLFKAIRYPLVIPSRQGTYPAAVMLLNHDPLPKLKHAEDEAGHIISSALVALVQQGPDSPGAAELVRVLVNREDAAVWKHYEYRGNILQLAASEGRTLMVKALLESSVIQRQIADDSAGKAALHDACSGGNADTVKALLEKGADVNLRCGLNGWTPLHYAVLAGGTTVQALLNGGADPHVTSDAGNTALHLAATLGTDIRIEPMLTPLWFRPEEWPSVASLKLHPRLTAAVVMMLTMIYLPILTFLSQIKFLGRQEVTTMDVDIPNTKGETALTIALRNHNHRMTTKLLDAGASPGNISRDLPSLTHSLNVDERLAAIRRQRWKPIASYEIYHILNQAFFPEPKTAQPGAASSAKRKLPIQIVSRILFENDVFEKLTSERHDLLWTDDSIWRTGDNIYLASEPIMGNASQPINSISLRVCSRALKGAEWAFTMYHVKTVDRTTGTVTRWPDVEIMRNRAKLEEKEHTFTMSKEKASQFHLISLLWSLLLTDFFVSHRTGNISPYSAQATAWLSRRTQSTYTGTTLRIGRASTWRSPSCHIVTRMRSGMPYGRTIETAEVYVSVGAAQGARSTALRRLVGGFEGDERLPRIDHWTAEALNRPNGPYLKLTFELEGL